MSTIIYGPHGSGKTKFAKYLASYFNHSNIVDNYCPGDVIPDDSLILTNVENIPDSININTIHFLTYLSDSELIQYLDGKTLSPIETELLDRWVCDK